VELSRQTVELTEQGQRRTLELTEQGQVADRYTKAIEQLGSEKLDVRIGGIYALGRVARDSARDHPAVMEVLSAFIREHSRGPWPQPDHPASMELQPSTRPDVQAAATVIGRRDKERDLGRIDLTGARLIRVNLVEANADLLEHRRGGNRHAAVIMQERDDLAAYLKRRHVAAEVDAILALDIQHRVPVQHLRDRDHTRHDNRPAQAS
jgi:hypothetical protein